MPSLDPGIVMDFFPPEPRQCEGGCGMALLPDEPEYCLTCESDDEYWDEDERLFA